MRAPSTLTKLRLVKSSVTLALLATSVHKMEVDTTVCSRFVVQTTIAHLEQPLRWHVRQLEPVTIIAHILRTGPLQLQMLALPAQMATFVSAHSLLSQTINALTLFPSAQPVPSAQVESSLLAMQVTTALRVLH